MKKLLILIALVTNVAILYSQGITGTVIDEATGNGLPGASVVLEPGSIGVASDANGHFEFKDIESGSYILNATFLGYSEFSKSVIVKDNQIARISVSLRPTTIEAEEVVVTATKTERKLEDVPNRVELINAKQFSAIPSVDLSGYLKQSSGVSVYNPGGFISHKTNVVMRGMSGVNQSRVLVLKDGIPINKADGGSVNWNLIQVDQVDRVEISKGPGSSLYGGNALGGVINMITKAPVNKFQGSVKAEYGSMNTYGGRFNIGGNGAVEKASGFYYSLNGYYRQSDGYINQALENEDREYVAQPDTASTTVNNTMEEYGADIKAGYIINEDSRIELAAAYYDDRRESGYKYQAPEGSYMDHDSKSFSAMYRGNVGGMDIIANAWYRNEDYKKLSDSDRDSKYYSVISDRQDIGAQIHGSFSLGESSVITVGVDAKQGSVDAVDKYILVTDRVYNQGKMNSMALFVQEELKAFDDKFSLVAGLRFDHARYFDGSYHIADATSATSILQSLEDLNQDEHKWNAISPRVSAQYRFTQDIRVYATYSNGFRPSVLDDLCRSGFVRGGFKKANPNLEPERLNSYELGADLHFAGLSVSPSVYFSKGKDFMYYVSTGDTIQMGSRRKPVRQVENIGEVEIKGAELKLDYNILPTVNVFANYTYNESKITEFDPEYSSQSEDITGNYLTYVPFNQFAAGLSWRNPVVNASLSLNSVGEHYSDDQNTSKIDTFTTFDLRLWRSFGRLNLKLDVQNLLDKVALVDDGYINYGRFLRIEMTYNF